MDASSPPKPQRLTVYSADAALDLAEIHTHTALHWGWEQAERYVELIKNEAQNAAATPRSGRPVAGFEDVFTVTVKWKNAKYAHYIVYKPIENGIYISRILHSAMDMPSHLHFQ